MAAVLDVVVSPSNSLLRKQAREWLTAAKPPVVLLIPSARAAEDLLYGGIEPGMLGLHRYTPRQLAASVASPTMVREGLAPLTGLGTRAVLAKVVSDLLARQALPYYEPVARMPGFLRSAAATVEELRLEGIAPGDLQAAGASGKDLGRILQGFLEECGARRLLDYAGILRAAARPEALEPHLTADKPLLAYGIAVKSKAEREMLAALVDRAPQALLVIPEADEDLRTWIERKKFAPVRRVEDLRTSGLPVMRRRLFTADAGEPAAMDGSFSLFSAPNEALECAEIARRLHREAENGVPFDRAAILLRHPDRYQPVLEEALTRAGIPAWFSGGVRRPHPAGRAFLTLIECAREGCSAALFAEYLSFGQVPDPERDRAPEEETWSAPADDLIRAAGDETSEEPEPEDDQVIHPRAWQRLLTEASVVGGRDRWKRRLTGLRREYEMRLTGLAAEAPEREDLERRLDRLGELEKFALPLVERLDALPISDLWGEWLDRLAELARETLRCPEPVLRMLAELEPMREAGPAGLDDVYRVLEERLRFLRREPAGKSFGKVFVGAIEEARGRVFSLAFLPGLAEGLFPARAVEDPLLLDRHREMLPPNTLARQAERVQSERTLLRMAAGSAQRLIASYPRMETAQARARVPSFYALELARAAAGHLPDLREFESKAAKGSETQIGWPAPSSPEEAIDEAEYDLSILEDALHRPPGSAVGIARYLMEVNPHLARSLRARFQKWRKGWTAEDGLVKLGEDAREVLRAHSLDTHPYSASALQLFAACPFRFALHSVLGLRPREDSAALERMDALTRGALFHEVQFAFLSGITRGREKLKRSLLPQMIERLDALLDRIAADYEEKLAPVIPRVWQNEVELLRSDLRGWLRDWVINASGWQPIHAELSFGLTQREGHDPASVTDPVEIGGIRLRGSVDLVEMREGKIRVTDHKTGKPPADQVVHTGGGRHLQPLLYSLAMEKLLGREVEGGRLSYCTHRGTYTELSIPLNEYSRATAAEYFEILNRAFETGFFPAAPAQEECSRCDFRRACGPYEELRIRKKPRPELADLQALRSLP